MRTRDKTPIRTCRCFCGSALFDATRIQERGQGADDDLMRFVGRFVHLKEAVKPKLDEDEK
jgi:hypothetical protein